MKRNIILICLLVLILPIFSNNIKKDDWPVLRGPYLSQKPPGKTPEIFAPGIISTRYSERIVCFAPDNKELFYAVWGVPHGVFFYTHEDNGKWTKPQTAPFSGRYGAEGTLSPDGNFFIYSSNMPLSGSGEPSKVYSCWISYRSGSGWSDSECIKLLSEPNNTNVCYPSVASSGNIYFYSDRKEGYGKDDIYISEFVKGKYTLPKNLGTSINTKGKDLDSCIAPDESYLIFVRNIGGLGGWDLFISFKTEDGSWSKAINMGSGINTVASDFCPTISLDGKYFFFTSNRRLHEPYSEIPLTYERKLKILNSPGNGSSDIYWVDAKFIEELKKNL